MTETESDTMRGGEKEEGGGQESRERGREMLWEALINKNLKDVKRGQRAKQPVFAGLREERVMGKKETDERGKGSQEKEMRELDS